MGSGLSKHLLSHKDICSLVPACVRHRTARQSTHIRLLQFSPLRMCTQRVIWCGCGHGEFLQPKRCPVGARHGNCWLVLHGDHRVVVDMKCSYCKAGLNVMKPLCSPRPRGRLAKEIEDNMGEMVVEQDCDADVMEQEPLSSAVGSKPTTEFDDVLYTDFGNDFNLSDELWQYE